MGAVVAVYRYNKRSSVAQIRYTRLVVSELGEVRRAGCVAPEEQGEAEALLRKRHFQTVYSGVDAGRIAH